MKISQILPSTSCVRKLKSTPSQRVQLIGEVDNFVRQKVNNNSDMLNSLAKEYNTIIKIAQRKLCVNGKDIDRVYINSGAITSTLDLSEREGSESFYTAIVNNVLSNLDVKKDGLYKTHSKYMERKANSLEV